MKLGEYVEALYKLIDENPEIANDDIFYYSDDEGNDLKRVIFTPTLINIRIDELESNDVRVVAEDDLDDYDKEDIKSAVCIN